jgi:hypothetical protein
MCDILIINGKYFFASYSQLKTGLWFSNGTFTSIPLDASNDEIIKNIDIVLRSSVLDVEAIDDVTNLTKRFLKGLKVKSMKELHNHATSFGIILNNNIFSFIPTINLGHKNGFEPILNLQEEISCYAEADKIVAIFKSIASKCR